MNATKNIQTGLLTTCQFGNPGDTHWSEETHAHQAVRVLDIQKGISGKELYLVLSLNTVGVAIEPPADYEIAGVLYCTTALLYNNEAELQMAIGRLWPRD